MYSHRVTGLANVVNFKDYGYQHSHHLLPWLKAKFNLTAQHDCYTGWNVWVGDYDLDIPVAHDRTIFGAALEYGMCYDGELFDRLVTIETGINHVVNNY